MIRVGLLGLGAVAEQIHLPSCAFLPEVRLVGACEPNADRRERIGRRFGIPALYEDAAALLEKEKPEAVIIATPPDSHHRLSLLALEHGAHVFCEKPFVRSVAEADEVIAAAERRQRTVVVNNQYRFMKVYRRAQERIAHGEFGRPFLIQCWQQMFHPPSAEQNWRSQLAQSTLFEFGTHPLDLICFFFGDYPVSVTAQVVHTHGDIQSDVVVQMTLKFPGERLATVILNRVSHALERYLEMRVDCERASLRLSFGGVARGSVEWSRTRHWPIARFSLVKGGEARIEIGGRSKVIAREWADGRPAATALNLRHLIDITKNGRASNDRARHARELIRIVEAGYESARIGQSVCLRESSI
jgi:predicted dehydrogenase